MPLKIHLGVTKKVGLPQYSSAGASCHVEMEVDSSLLQNNLEAFHTHVRQAYASCREAVQEELAQHQQPAAATLASPEPNGNGSANGDANGKGTANGSGTGNGIQRATPKQREFIQQLARQIKGLGTRRLETLAQQMFAKPLAELSSLDASALIDCLKNVRAGQTALDAELAGAAHEG